MAFSILFLYIAVMAYVVIYSFLRNSGFTGMDMAMIQQLRYENVKTIKEQKQID